MALTDLEKAIIRELENDLPLDPRPFLIIAQRLGISEAELLQKLQEFQEQGVIRRFGAALRHRAIGLTANPIIVWNVPENLMEAIGRKMASYPEITHCYQRPPLAKLPYNLYTIIHCQTKEECLELAAHLSRETGITEYELLFSTMELKKTSMKYFR